MQLIPNIMLNQASYLNSRLKTKLISSHVQIGFINAHGLNQIGIAFKNFSDLETDSLVLLVVARDENCLRTTFIGLFGTHSRMDPIFSGFIIAGRYHSSSARQTRIMSNDDRLSLQFRMVALFNGRKKGIHIHMNDLTARIID